MIVFLDFEASSLGKRGFPIEVGWAAEDGSERGSLIRPAPGWEEWSAEAEGIHGITRERLLREGEPHEAVAARLVEQLTGHALYASAPSWDGQWLSRLLRAAGLPRHALRLRDTDEAQAQAATESSPPRCRRSGLPPRWSGSCKGCAPALPMPRRRIGRWRTRGGSWPSGARSAARLRRKRGGDVEQSCAGEADMQINGIRHAQKGRRNGCRAPSWRQRV